MERPTIRTAVIPAAGLGTRLRPATRAVPKVLLPIIDKPVLQVVAEEAVRSGVEQVIIIVGRDGPAIERHFTADPALDAGCTLRFVSQPEPRGLGDAVACAREHVGDEPFAVLLGDTVIAAPDGPGLQQITRVHAQEAGASVVAVHRVAPDQLERYGVVIPDGERSSAPARWRLRGLVEKPPPGTAPSNLAIAGRYVFTPRIFDCLDRVGPGAGGEIQLTDAMNLLAAQAPVFAHLLDGQRYDIGDRAGYARCFVDFARRDPALAIVTPEDPSSCGP